MAGERHHYVPKFLLKNFTAGKKQQIWVYDKSNDKKFQSHIKNVAVEKGFYDLEVDDGVLTLEPDLAHLEGNSSKIVKKILKEQTLQTLDQSEMARLALFLAVQFVRTKEHRLRVESLFEIIDKKLREMGVPDEQIKDQLDNAEGLPQDKLIGLKAILDAKEFAPHFLNKEWVLFQSSNKAPFYISDNPITLHNNIDHGPRGSIGLAVKGIEIYLPISTTFCIGLLCPSVAANFQKVHREILILDKSAPGLADSLIKNARATRSYCEGLVNKTPIPLVEENVTMMNSLQIMYSSRFVYCEREAFDLVHEMLSDDEKYRGGLKPSVG